MILSTCFPPWCPPHFRWILYASNKCEMFLFWWHWNCHAGNTKIYFGSLSDPCLRDVMQGNVWASRFNISERDFWPLSCCTKTIWVRAYTIGTCSTSMDLYILIYPFVFLLIFCWTALFLLLLYHVQVSPQLRSWGMEVLLFKITKDHVRQMVLFHIIHKTICRQANNHSVTWIYV